MTTIDHDAIRRTLAGIELTHGLGTDAHHACSIAAINLAVTGTLTDKLHPCMSPVVRQWVVRVQDEMPLVMMSPEDEHGARWRDVLPLVAGSAGRGLGEARMVDLILGWLWDRLGDSAVLASVPTVALTEWDRMLSSRTEAAVDACRFRLRRQGHLADAANYAFVARAEAAPSYAVWAASYAGRSAAATSARSTAFGTVAYNAAYEAAQLAYWRRADPAALLAGLVGAA